MELQVKSTKQDHSKNMVHPTNQPVSNINISTGRDNEEIIKNSIRRSKRKYFRDVRSCYSKVSNANSSWRKATTRYNFNLSRICSSRKGSFSTQGKIIEESGCPHILDECKFLGKGLINSFLRGKSYKRC